MAGADRESVPRLACLFVFDSCFYRWCALPSGRSRPPWSRHSSIRRHRFAFVRRIWLDIGPLALTLAIVAATIGALWSRFGPLVALAGAVFTFLINVPLLSFFWGYLTILIGLNRLGGHRLDLEPFPPDRNLGLRPLGRLAFTGFFFFLVGSTPILVANTTDPINLTAAIPVILVGVVAFFVSLGRMHNQMRDAKERYLDSARMLYAEAFAPLASSPTVDVLMAQSAKMEAAEKLEKRAEAVFTWPFEPVVLSQMVALVAGIVAAVITRALLIGLDL